MRTIGLTPSQQVELITAYAAPMCQIDAVVAEPGWNVVGVFKMPSTYPAKLEVIGLVSVAGTTLRARLFDLTTGLAVPNSDVAITATVSTDVTSNPVTLVGGHLYQMHAEVIGASGFGIFFTGSLV